ncbi:hypothetical protein [Luteolibacter soli]|uniref:Uncharacterized protein n=1 Tax=Luteolibacter soli TaxID=3135280 RepID=A0ABU9AVB6_9BACT
MKKHLSSKAEFHPSMPMRTPDPYANRRSQQFASSNFAWWMAGLIATGILAAVVLAARM